MKEYCIYQKNMIELDLYLTYRIKNELPTLFEKIEKWR